VSQTWERHQYYKSKTPKLTFLIRYKSGYFTNQSIPTIGCDFVEKTEKIDGKNVKVKIWDTSGQERYRSLTKNFYSQADGVIVVYDITERSTFDRVRGWIDSVLENKDSVNMILVGNKIDLDNHREVQKEEGMGFALKSSNIPFYETSAKENIEIDHCIMDLVREIMNSERRKNKTKGDSLDNLNTPDTNSSYACCYS
jgi:Ras-related protein Rab-1A